jgi:hypothetical protein
VQEAFNSGNAVMSFSHRDGIIIIIAMLPAIFNSAFSMENTPAVNN